MLNRVILIGRLTQDPQMRYTPNGVAVCTFTLAVNRSYTNQSGERQADFLDIVTWRQLAENCANYLAKGRLVAVEGRIQTRTYETAEGQKRKVFEIIADTVKFLEKAGTASGFSQTGKGSVESEEWESLSREVDVDMIVKDDDDIPF